MVDPHNGPDNDYDHLSPLEPEVAIDSERTRNRVYSCCTLDDKLPHVRSWRDVLVSAKFPTAVYDQVDKTGPLERPVRELVEVVRALDDKYDMQLVLLAHSAAASSCAPS
jgi:hypothetical protein